MIRSDTILRLTLTLLFTYLVAIGATFNGLVFPQFRMITLTLMALILIIWLIVRWRRGWRWHTTPLDGVFLLWALAFGLSLAANGDSWRRIDMGLWHVGVYVVVWYVLQDALANRGINREVLVDALLIAGLVVMIFAVWQVKSWLDTRWPLITAGLAPFDLPRPVSTLGNTNALGGFLVVLAPFALGRWVSLRNRFGRVVLGLYSALAVLLLFFTYSRGTWLGFTALIIVFAGLLLSHDQMLSAARLRQWWRARSRRGKIVLLSLSVSIFSFLLIGIALFALSFSVSGRGLDRRTVLYRPAIEMFTESPITGQGLFTFGKGYSRLVSIPPNQSHSHAHNAVLHIAAELGLVGLAALFATLGVMILTMRRNWRHLPPRAHFGLAGAVAAVTGFAVHHLLDTPSMMPAIALAGLLALALAPVEPLPVNPRRRYLGIFGITGLSVALIVSGFWSSSIYARYIDALRYGVSSGDYIGAAEQLQPVIDADSSLGLYHLEQAYLFGLAADEGDTQAAHEAIAAYSRFLELEPQHAIAWANKAALYRQVGQLEQAVESMRRAAECAPSSWQLAFNLAAYAESAGDGNTARTYYERALNAISRMYPVWDETELRREVVDDYQASGLSQVVLLLENGDIQESLNRWESLAPQKTPAYDIVRMLLALANGERGDAFVWLAQAREVMIPADPEHEAWIRLGTARIAQYDGDNSAAAVELAAARDLLEPSLGKEDVTYSLNIAYAQFLRMAIARQFLPQVYYPTADPLLVRLLTGS